MTHLFQIFFSGFACLAFALTACAAPFVAPSEENPPFRRDLLPIDMDSMTKLSRDLTLLVCGIPLETAAQRRAAAQSLALALALDPANSGARDIISQLAAGKLLPAANLEQLIYSKARLWQAYAWLDAPESGADGQLLGDMLGDAVSVLDSNDPVSITLQKGLEKGKWAELVAPLPDFDENPIAKNVPAESETNPVVEAMVEKPDDQVPLAQAPNGPAMRLQAGVVSSVFFVYDKTMRSWSLRPASVEMQASPEGGSGAFEIAIASVPTVQDAITNSISQPILKAVEAYHSSLPKNGLVSITTNGGGRYSLSRNRTNMTGPGFILANSAITGVETEATVIATLDSTNTLVPPQFFWRLISALADGNGGRLVVPLGTEEYFTALLTLEKPEFFLKYEVLVASTPKEFMEFCAKTSPEAKAASFAKFQEIKIKAGGGSLGTYLANRFVRQRLQEIVDAAPYHLSARLLAMQSAGERPRWLTRKVLAADLWRAIAPIEGLLLPDFGQDDAESVKNLDALYDRTRAEVDYLERYADIRDRDLINEARDLTTTFRTFTRASRSRTDDFGERYQEIRTAHVAMMAANNALLVKLSQLSGDPFPSEGGRFGGSIEAAEPGEN